MVDEALKREDIEGDYYRAIVRYNLTLKNLKSSDDYIINGNDTDEQIKIKNATKDAILADFGIVGELAFKYIVKIKRFELFQNEPYNDTIDSKGNKVIGFKSKETLPISVINEIADKIHVPFSKVDSIKKVQGVGPRAHDFNYVYKIIENLFPDIIKSFNKFIEFVLKSKAADKASYDFSDEIDKTDYYTILTFPSSIRISDDENEEKQEILRAIKSKVDAIEYHGDINTRLRYFSNNPNDKSYDVEELHDLISYIITYVEAIHLCGDKLDVNPELLFAFYILNKNPEVCRFTLLEVKELMSNKKIQQNPDILMDALFYCDLSFEEINKLLALDSIENYTGVFCENITADIIKYFNQYGITDIYDMVHVLDLKGYGSFFDLRFTLEELEQLRIGCCNNSSDFSNLKLLRFMTAKSLQKLSKKPDLLSFFKDEMEVNTNFVSYKYNDDELFDMFLNNKELCKNPIAFYGLDIDQLICYAEFTNLLCKNPLNDDVINKTNFHIEKLDEHISENIKRFSHNPKLLCVLPMMLDPDDNEQILSYLVDNGLDINDLRGLDTTIFCMPVLLVKVICDIFKKDNIPLIINNNINPIVYQVIDSIKTNYKFDRKLPRRRVPFIKSHFTNTAKNQNNEVVHELTFEKPYILEIESTKNDSVKLF